MTGLDQRLAELVGLAAEIREDMAAAEDLTTRINGVLVSPAGETAPTWEVKMGLALALNNLYSAWEQAFERILAVYDRTTPSGSDWHRELVRRLGIALPSIRPAVLTTATASDLDEFRGFRHVVRHSYAVQLNWDRLKGLASRAPGVLAKLHAELSAFLNFVEEEISDLGKPNR